MIKEYDCIAEEIHCPGLKAAPVEPAMLCPECGKGELYPYSGYPGPFNGQQMAAWNEPLHYVQRGEIRLMLRCSECGCERWGEFAFQGFVKPPKLFDCYD